MARLLFLGRLEDIAGAGEMHMPLPAPTPLAEVIARLPDDLAAAVSDPRIRLAVNGVLCPDRNRIIAVADELAFLPPVSGG
jgi:molybdopterin synthase sulfur carrier subunit